MKTLLVIGGTGFFGKSILDAFGRGLLKPWAITHVISMSRNAQSLLQDAPELVTQGVELLTADIRNSASLPEADYVIHAAASTDIRNYLSKPEQEMYNIQAGTYNFCELVKKTHKKSKIVYVSSGAVYGVQPDDLEKVSEEFQYETLDSMDAGKIDYAIAKQNAESAIKALANDEINISIARCFAFVGPWLPRNQHFVVGNFIDDILNKRPIIVKAAHEVIRSYMYADDLVVWLMAIANFGNSKCPTFNVGSDDAINVKSMAFNLAKSSKLEVSLPDFNSQRVDRYIPSIDKAKDILNLTLSYNSIDSINKTIRDCKELTTV